MPDIMELIFRAAMYLAEGWCIQYLFRAFVQPRLPSLPWSGSAVGLFWFAWQMVCSLAGPDNFSSSLLNLLLYLCGLLVFSQLWYQGGFLLKLFLVVQFTAIHELSTWTSNSMIWFSSTIGRVLAEGVQRSLLSLEAFTVSLRIVSTLFVLAAGALREIMTWLFIRRIVRSCTARQRFERDLVFYLLPAGAAVLTAALIRLLIITVRDGYTITIYESYPLLYLILPLIALTLLTADIFSFETWQRMTQAQQERAERLILENQLSQLQNTMLETESRYEGLRAVKHDMKNHMMVLQRLLNGDGDRHELQQYYESLCTAVEQLDSPVRTGNSVCDVVIGSKFQTAMREIPGIRLDADSFLLQDAGGILPYDLGIILSNGLDNAIEGCARLRQKQPDADAYITVRSFTRGKMLFLEIENSFDGAVQTDPATGLPRSTKDQADTHGIGLKNVRSCARKYGGEMDCITEGRSFTLSVMLKKMETVSS